MPLLLFLASAGLVLLLVHRFVRAMSLRAAVFLALVPLFLTGRALITGAVYGPIDHLYQYEPLSAQAQNFGIDHARNASATDIWSEFFPWRLAVKESFARGDWPLWNAYNLTGHPLAAESQSAPYSPFTWIALLLPAAASMSYTAAMVMFLAGVCAFVFARELDCGELASLVAAVGWGLAPCIVLYAQTAMGFSTLYAPLILAATRRVVWTPGLRSGALLMISLALTALAGHPESLFLNVLVACAYGLIELVRRRVSPLHSIAAALIAGILAFTLSGIALVPLIVAVPQSIEYRAKSDSAVTFRRGLSRNHVLASLATDVFPHLHVREWEKPKLGYIGAETSAAGSIILGLAILAVVRRRTPETWFFAALAVPCMLLGARWGPLADTLQAIPLVNITFHDRLAFHGALCLIVLAALSLQSGGKPPHSKAFGILLAVLAAGMFWLRRNVTLATTPLDYGALRPYAELGFLAAAAVILAFRTRFALPLLLACVLGQRVVEEIDTFRTFPAEAAYPKIAALEPLNTIREPFRIVGLGLTLPPATSTFYGLEDVRGYDALTLAQYSRTWKLWCRRHGIWFNRVDDLTAPILSMMNVRFAIQPLGHPERSEGPGRVGGHDDRPAPPGQVPRYARDDIPPGWRRVNDLVLENMNVIDRVFVPSRVTLVDASAEELVDRMAGVRDFRAMGFITSPDAVGERDNGPGTIALRRYSRGGDYLFDADMQRDGYVVVSDASWLGWQATVDGRRAPLSRANAAFLAVHVPQGRHRVRLVYWPWSFVQGRALTMATLLMLLGIAALVYVHGKGTLFRAKA